MISYIDSNESSQSYMDNLFIQSCAEGNLNTIKELMHFTVFKPDIYAQECMGMRKALKNHCHPVIDYLCNECHFVIKKEHKFIFKSEFQKMLHEGSLYGNEYIAKFALCSPLFSTHADIHYKNDEALRLGAKCGNIELVQYLLTSPDLKHHANIKAMSNNALKQACESGHLKMVEYLTSSPELKQHANIYDMENNHSNHKSKSVFTISCKLDNTKIRDYFLYDLKMTINEEVIKDINASIKSQSAKAEIFHAISKRDMFFRMNEEFEKKTTKVAKL